MILEIGIPQINQKTGAYGTPKINLGKAPYLNEGLSMAILGNKGSGKSYTMAVLAEEMHRNKLPFIFFDINGDAVSLRQLGDDIIVLGNPKNEGKHHPHYDLEHVTDTIENLEQYINFVLEDGFSLVVDLSFYKLAKKATFLAQIVNTHYELAEKNRQSVAVFVDECHRFAPQRKGNSGQQMSFAALDQVMSDGRKRGMLFVAATQRIAFLNKDILYGMNLRFFGKITWKPDFDHIKYYLPPNISFRNIQKLNAGEFYVTGVPGSIDKIKVKQRQTKDFGKTPAIKSRSNPRPNLNQLALFKFDDFMVKK